MKYMKNLGMRDGFVVYGVEEDKIEELLFGGKYIYERLGRKLEWKVKNIRTGFECIVEAIANVE